MTNSSAMIAPTPLKTDVNGAASQGGPSMGSTDSNAATRLPNDASLPTDAAADRPAKEDDEETVSDKEDMAKPLPPQPQPQPNHNKVADATETTATQPVAVVPAKISHPFGDTPRGEAKIIPANIVVVNGQDLFIPTEHDVLLGRGKPFQCHAGNIRFHDMVDNLRPRYVNAKRYDKLAISTQIVKTIKFGGEFRGRFLQRVEGTDKWEEVPDQVAREKASHALRGKPRKEEYRNSAVRNIKNGNTPGVITMKPDPNNPQPPPSAARNCATMVNIGGNMKMGSMNMPTMSMSMGMPTGMMMNGMSGMNGMNGMMQPGNMGGMGMGGMNMDNNNEPQPGDDQRKRSATSEDDGSGTKRQRFDGTSQTNFDGNAGNNSNNNGNGNAGNNNGNNHAGGSNNNTMMNNQNDGGASNTQANINDIQQSIQQHQQQIQQQQQQLQQQQQQYQQQHQQRLHSQMPPQMPPGQMGYPGQHPNVPQMGQSHYGNMTNIPPGFGPAGGPGAGGPPPFPPSQQMMSAEMMQQLGSMPIPASTPLLAATTARNGLGQQPGQAPGAGGIGGLAALSEASSSAQPLLTEALMRRRQEMDTSAAHMLARQHLLESMLQRERAEQILRDVQGGYPKY